MQTIYANVKSPWTSMLFIYPVNILFIQRDFLDHFDQPWSRKSKLRLHDEIKAFKWIWEIDESFQ